MRNFFSPASVYIVCIYYVRTDMRMRLICSLQLTMILFPWSTDTIESILFCFVSVRKKLWMMWIVGPSHHCYDCTSAQYREGWDRGLYEIIVQCPPFPLILLLFFEFVSLCFHVLLVIRLSAGLYWITPEAHQRINDVGSERGTQIQRLIKSRALQIIVMWWISLKSSKAMNGGLNWIEISILGSFLI